MSERQRIEQGVARLRRVRRWQLIADYLVRGLFWGSLPAALCILASRLFILPASEYILAGSLLASVAAAFAFAGALHRLSPLAVANDIDLSLGLKERVSSALALDRGASSRDPFVRALVKDAVRLVEQVSAKKVYPWRVPRAWRLALPAVAIAALLSFVPQLNLFVNQTDRAEGKHIQTYGSQLKKLAEQVRKEAEKKQDPVLRKQAEEIRKVGEKLDRQQATKKDALKELQKLREKLETQQFAQVPQGEKNLIAELGRNLADLKYTSELGEALKGGSFGEFSRQTQPLLQNLQAGKMTPEQQALLKEMLKAVEQTLNSDAARDPEAQKLAEQLKALKDAAENAEQMRRQLQETISSLQKDIDNLTQQLQQSGMGQQAEELRQQMQQLQQQMALNGALSQQAIQEMAQTLDNTQQAISQNQQLSAQQKQQLGQACQQCQSYFQGQKGQSSQSGQSGEQGQNGEPGSQGESLGEQNSQLSQQLQQMGEQLGKQGDCMGGG